MKTNKIEIYGTVYEYGDVTAKSVSEQLDVLNGEPVELRINSPGGDVFESIAILNRVKAYAGTKRVVIDGLAGSGASIIAMCGDEIIMPKNAMMMIHNAAAFAYGNAQEFIKIADTLAKIDGAVKACYAERFVGSDGELKEMLNEETWLSADECKALGFCTAVSESEATPSNNIKDKILNKYAPDLKRDEPSEPDKVRLTARLMSGFFNTLEQKIVKEN